MKNITFGLYTNQKSQHVDNTHSDNTIKDELSVIAD